MASSGPNPADWRQKLAAMMLGLRQQRKQMPNSSFDAMSFSVSRYCCRLLRIPINRALLLLQQQFYGHYILVNLR